MSSDEQKRRISVLIHKRGTIKSQLTTFKSFLDKFSEHSDHTRLSVRVEKLSDAFANFDDIQTELEMLDTEVDHASVRVELTESYYDHLALARRYQQGSASAPREINASPLTAETSVSSIKLPEINIPVFDGSLERWLSFRDSFCSMVDRKPGLTGVDKLHYLRSFLRGEALETIESLEMIDDNYVEAWQLLNDTYNNKRVIILRHSYLLLNLPSVPGGSSSGLRDLINAASQHLRSLKALGQPVEHWDTLLVTAIQTKLDNKTLREWEATLKNDCVPSFEALISFLRKVASRMQSSVPFVTQDNKVKSTHNTSFNQHLRTNRKTLTITLGKCSVCEDAHPITNCKRFLGLTASNRIEAARKALLCLNCLRSGHKTIQCASPGRCHTCMKRHHTLLHVGLPNENPSQVREAGQSVEPLHVVKTFGPICNTLTQDLLITAIIYAQHSKGHQIRCRTLLDTCSSTNFITEELATALGLPSTQCSFPIETLNDSRTIASRLVTTTIQSRNGNYARTLTFLTVPQICQQVPGAQIDRETFEIPRNVSLADPTFHRPNKIDMLLSSGITLSLLCIGQIRLSSVNSPDLILQKTRLGWVVGGSTSVPSFKPPVCHANSVHFDLARFWEIEEIHGERHLSEDETLCEDHFRRFTTRTSAGRYIVALPFSERLSRLGCSRTMALKRLTHTERKLRRDKELREQYDRFLREYLELGHMTRLNNDPSIEHGFYLPHHGVIKETSTTTKLRVVFDGSARSTTGVSLNDALLVGPTIQSDLFSLLLRFRTHTYALTGDIEKMYRQVLVREEDRKYQKILYRNELGQLDTFALNTVTYGLSSAPYLAIRCLHALADDDGDKFPLAARILKRDFYVDDLLTGADSQERLLTIRKQLSELLALGGFNIRQWASNEPTVLSDLSTGSINTPLIINNDNRVKTLGVLWNSQNDTISYTVQSIETTDKITKRTVLSEIAKIFDPLGLLGPVIMRAKILMQRLWLCQLQWDESVPADIYTEWCQFASQLPFLNDLLFERKLLRHHAKYIELHGFCDASERGYGACFYVKSLDDANNVQISLLCAKSRVAPLKSISLPRLELCGALLLSTLYESIKAALEIKIFKTFLWSDSTITIHWIHTSPHMLNTFVANRVSQIQAKTNARDWRHVRSHDNPADALSRGQLPKDFIDNGLWKNGPHWLHHNEESWPIQNITFSSELPELKKAFCFTTITVNNELINKYSDITRLRRIIALCLRFKLTNTSKGPISARELENANICVIKLVQAETFSDELKALKRHETIHTSSKLTGLNPFLDDDEIIRVGGRLRHACASYNQRHPIIMPRSHHISSLIIRHEHLNNHHSGIQSTLYSLRHKYWFLNGRSQVRKVIRQCVKCFRVKPGNTEYIMGDLPRVRVTEARPFLNVGVDFCGPFFIKERRHRNRTKVKVYVAVFICLVVKAMHLEIVSDLTSEGFIAALRRFVARRGNCQNIYSDNGTNFVGADAELKEIISQLHYDRSQDQVGTYLANKGIRWHFIPPHSPHFGGLWEAGVKSYKHHMKRVIGNALFSFEDLNTFVIEVEAILNSRPLLPISTDPNDPMALTPGHFLIGDALTSPPDHDYRDTPSNRLSTWQHIQKVKQHFWNRWHKEYIAELNMRHKWTGGKHDLNVGTVVVIKEDHTPPMQWKLGRVVEVHPGSDGIIRTVTIKTSTTTVKRNVRKLAPLPLSDSMESDVKPATAAKVPQ